MASFPTSYLPDEDEEERLAEIERLTSGFGTELAAGMAAGGLPVGAGDPEPVDPRAGQNPPIALGVRTGARPLPMMDEDFGGATPTAPTPQQMARANGQQLPAAPQRAAQAPAQQLPSIDPDQSGAYQGQLSGLDDQQRRERRRRGILSAVLSPFMGGAEGADRFINQNAPQYDQRREQLGAMLIANREQRAAQQAARQRSILEQAAALQRQTNADRTFGQQQAEFNYQRERDAANRTQDQAQFQQGQAQDMKERVLGFEAADTRSQRHANAMVGRDPNSGGIVRPGTVPTGPAAPGMGQMLDAPIIQALIDNRPEIMQGARAEAERRRAAGQEADVGAIAWEMGSGMFGRLPRDEQDRIRRAYISPESTNTAVTAPVREEQALATRVRQYGQEARERIEWERSVGAANQVLGGVNDAELRAAQQWIQGGAARQSIAAGLAPRAEQIGETITTLQNIMLRERSGAAVTDQEFQRLRGELGSNWWSSPDSLRRAVARMRATNEAIQEGLGAEYGLDVVEAYDANRQAVRGHRGGAPATGGGRYRAGQTITGPNGATRTLTQEQADRLNARGQ